MKKVAFYIDNNKISKVDCSKILTGNPGIGGTEYLFYSTTYLLMLHATDNLNIVLLTSDSAILPSDFNYKTVGTKKDAIEFCEKENYDILIVKYEEKDYNPNIFKNINGNLNIFVWAHNIIPNHILTIIDKTKAISKIINVGREQLDLYRDHNAFYKSTYIYNSLNVRPIEYYLENSIPFEKRKNEVTYLGSLVPIKGFHILAKAWPKILEKCPDAHLNVIGSGTVYGDAKLGKYGIAEENYENIFMPYLTDKNGDILPSVTFYGKLGNEKYDILARTKVGVPNPLGYSETFCLSAVEMELYGCRIVTKKYVGYLDTIPQSGGQLFVNENCLFQYIIEELKKKTYNDFHITYNYINSLFSKTYICQQWFDLLSNKNESNFELINSSYNFKFLREFNRKLKGKIPFGFLMPTIDEYIRIINIFLPFIKIKKLY